jgi:hypothetical protein
MRFTRVAPRDAPTFDSRMLDRNETHTMHSQRHISSYTMSSGASRAAGPNPRHRLAFPSAWRQLHLRRNRAPESWDGSGVGSLGPLPHCEYVGVAQWAVATVLSGVVIIEIKGDDVKQATPRRGSSPGESSRPSPAVPRRSPRWRIPGLPMQSSVASNVALSQSSIPGAICGYSAPSFAQRIASGAGVLPNGG